MLLVFKSLQNNTKNIVLHSSSHLFQSGVREAVALDLELGHVAVEDGEELLELLDDGGVVGGEDVDDLGADLLEQPRVGHVLLDELGRGVRGGELAVGLQERSKARLIIFDQRFL